MHSLSKVQDGTRGKRVDHSLVMGGENVKYCTSKISRLCTDALIAQEMWQWRLVYPVSEMMSSFNPYHHCVPRVAFHLS